MLRTDTLYQFEEFLRTIPREEAAGLLYSYFLESNHNGWDGWSRRDLTGIRNLCRDMMLYHGAGKEDDPTTFSRPISNGAVTY